MVCEVCGVRNLPADASKINTQGIRVICRGRIYAIISPEEAVYSPYSHYHTVSLYPRKGRVKYLKFATRNAMDRWGFEREATYTVQGCLHVCDGKELMFDITSAQREGVD